MCCLTGCGCPTSAPSPGPLQILEENWLHPEDMEWAWRWLEGTNSGSFYTTSGCVHDSLPEEGLSKWRQDQRMMLCSHCSSLTLLRSQQPWQPCCFLPHVRGPWRLLKFLMQPEPIYIYWHKHVTFYVIKLRSVQINSNWSSILRCI